MHISWAAAVCLSVQDCLRSRASCVSSTPPKGRLKNISTKMLTCSFTSRCCIKMQGMAHCTWERQREAVKNEAYLHLGRLGKFKNTPTYIHGDGRQSALQERHWHVENHVGLASEAKRAGP